MADGIHAYIQDVPIDEAAYRQIVSRIGDKPMDGSLLHLCIRREDGGLRYIDVWQSEAACARAFEEHIHPAVRAVFAERGIRPATEPTVQKLEVLDASGSLLPSRVL